MNNNLKKSSLKLAIATVVTLGAMVQGNAAHAFFGVITGMPILDIVACAPEVQEGNLKAADRVMGELAASYEFADAGKFQAQVKKIRGLSDPRQKTAAYFSLAGIDSNNTDEVAQVLGARDRSLDAKFLARIQSNTGISESQAQKVVDSLRAALVGNLQ